MRTAIYILEIVAITTAWALTQRRREHLPIAALFSIGLLSDLATLALKAPLAEATEHYGNAPWMGADRALGHLSDAATLAWPAALVGVALAAFLRRSPWPAVAAYAFALLTMVLLHPIANDGSLARALTALQLAAVLASFGCAITWYLRPHEGTSSAQACMGIIVAAELASLAGSWRIGVFADWHLSRIAYLVLYVTVIAIQGVYLCSTPKPRTSRS
jgi:hypothetical protein